MTPEDLDRIETELGVLLPEDFREFMANPPAEVAELDGDQLLRSADQIVTRNLEKRRLGEAQPPVWSPAHLIIGGDGTGGVFYLPLGQAPKTPVHFHHVRDSAEDNDRRVADTLTAWAARTAEFNRELDNEEAREAGGLLGRLLKGLGGH